MIKLGVIFGGRSGEHEISLMSAASVLRAIDRSKFNPITIGITKKGQWLLFEGSIESIEDGTWEERASLFNIGSLPQIIDFALPVLHGTFGEDGTIQGMFEMLDIPYGGCGVLASSVAMDKALAREVFLNQGIPMCKHLLITRRQLEGDFNSSEKDVQFSNSSILSEIENQIPYPVFVKPSNMGSSVGISKAKNTEELRKALNEAAKYDRRILIEQGIDVRELETAILGNENPMIAGVGEILPSAEFYDYTAKYFDGGKSQICLDANVSEEIKNQIKTIAIKAYTAIDCQGFARVDFFLEKETNKIYLNEINTIPGFTKISMFPVLWMETGMSYAQLIERIIELGYERHNAKDNR